MPALLATLALAAAGAAPTVRLPAQEDPAVWFDAVRLTGLALWRGSGPADVIVEVTGGYWTVRIGTDRVTMPAPHSEEDREDLAWLVASLLTPSPAEVPPVPTAPPEVPAVDASPTSATRIVTASPRVARHSVPQLPASRVPPRTVEAPVVPSPVAAPPAPPDFGKPPVPPPAIETPTESSLAVEAPPEPPPAVVAAPEPLPSVVPADPSLAASPLTLPPPEQREAVPARPIPIPATRSDSRMHWQRVHPQAGLGLAAPLQDGFAPSVVPVVTGGFSGGVDVALRLRLPVRRDLLALDGDEALREWDLALLAGPALDRWVLAAGSGLALRTFLDGDESVARLRVPFLAVEAGYAIPLGPTLRLVPAGHLGADLEGARIQKGEDLPVELPLVRFDLSLGIIVGRKIE